MQRAARYRSELLPRLHALLEDASVCVPPDPEVAQVHEHAVNAIGSGATAYEDIASGYETLDEGLLRQGAARFPYQVAEWLASGLGGRPLRPRVTTYRPVDCYLRGR